MRTKKIKQLTRLGDLEMKAQTEPTAHGRANNMQDAPQVLLPLVGQCRRGAYTPLREVYNMSVPVIGTDRKPLMPTTASRARRWIKNKEAVPFFKRGIFCVRLIREPSAQGLQQIAIGIDPGSKKEGLTVKSAAHTYLNIQADAVQHVKKAIEVRRMLRRTRRSRKAPCRKSRINRKNRYCSRLSPSTKARWQWKLRIVEQLANIFPITDFVVEDIKATSGTDRQQNKSFSPLEIGKNWFYNKLTFVGNVHLKQGWETAALREMAGLYKTKSKLDEIFEAHCVDSWVLANWLFGGHSKPDNIKVLYITPIRFHRRQLHVLQPAKGGCRKRHGGTRSIGFKRGSLVAHPKYGVVYIGGTTTRRISLHSIVNGKRLCKDAKPSDLKFKTYNSWMAHNV